MGETKKLLSNSGIVFAGTIIGSFFSYLFNMLAGRLLGPDRYGEFTALQSLLLILSVGGGALLTVTMKYSSELFTAGRFGALRKLHKIFSRYMLMAAVFLFLVSLVFIKPIGTFFSISQTLPIVITLSGFFFGFLITVNRGILQGSQQFLAVSLVGTLEMFLKLFIGVLLIKIGLGTNGALLGLILATALTYFVTFFPLRRVLGAKTKEEENFAFDKKEILKYSLPALLSAVFLTVALNVDILLIKHYFGATEAGSYAAISTIAKIVLYATGPIVSVMFPMISEKTVSGDKHYKLFLSCLILTLLGSLVILGVFNAIPGTVIRVLYGASFTGFYYLLPEVGFFALLYALVSLISSYFLVIKNYVFLPIFAGCLILQVALISVSHSDIETVVKILISTTALLFFLLFGYYLITKREQITELFRGKN